MTDDALPPLPTDWPKLEDPDLLDKIIEIIASEGAVEREKITPVATLETLGLASMDVMMILMGIEERLDVYLPMDTELNSARNLSELIAAIVHAMDVNRPQTEPAAE